VNNAAADGVSRGAAAPRHWSCGHFGAANRPCRPCSRTPSDVHFGNSSDIVEPVKGGQVEGARGLDPATHPAASGRSDGRRNRSGLRICRLERLRRGGQRLPAGGHGPSGRGAADHCARTRRSSGCSPISASYLSVRRSRSPSSRSAGTCRSIQHRRHGRRAAEVNALPHRYRTADKSTKLFMRSHLKRLGWMKDIAPM